MKRMGSLVATITLGLCLLLGLSGCGSDGDGNGGAGTTLQPASSSLFNGTFSGNLNSTQGGQNFVTGFTTTLTVNSPLSGTFSTDEGDTGTISGDAEGNSATYTATIEGACPGSLSGSMTLTDNDTISLEGSGSNCDGPFTATGTLRRSIPASTSRTSSSTREVVNRVLQILLGDDAGVSRGETSATGVSRLTQLAQDTAETREAVTLSVLCSTGQASFSGDAEVDQAGSVDSFTIDGTATFANCDSINGALTLDSSGTIGSRQITIDMTLHGSVNADGCNLTFTQFSIDTTTSPLGIVNSPIIGNGSLNATCDGESIACTLNDVDLEDVEAFENSCVSS